jgi:tetratricopeptide (TPR) repeat protein
LPRPEKARGIEGLRAELIGRDQELARLQEALAEVQRGRGQMVTLIGEAGVGKSRLVAELKQLARSPNLHASSLPHGRGPDLLWLEGRCLELGMSASYWLFVDLFRAYFGFAPEAEERQRAEHMVAALRELVERDDLTEERLEEIGPLLGNMLSLRFDTDWDQRLNNASPEQIKHQTFLAIRDLMLALAKRQPLILLCEDLHWADSLSLDVLSLLMESLTLAPILLLCVYRPEREHKCWHLATIASRKCPERYTEIALRELTPPQSRRLVESLLTIENLSASVKELILEKSRGNPFFVEEVVRSLIASGMVYREEEVWRAKAGIEAVSVPESVQSVILSRVDRLERELREVLERAAVIGRLFRRRLLERTTAQSTELERALWELEDQALIYQERVVPEEEYSFQHVLTQETIYQGILRRRRTVFHQQVAEAMEALYQDGLEEYYEQLAYHYERSGVDEKAIEYLLKAGEKARRAYLNQEAVDYLSRALERIERCRAQNRPTWRLQALTVLGQIHHRRGDEFEAEAAFREAVTLGKEINLPARERVRLYWWLADVLFWQYRFAEVIAVWEEGLALLEADDQSVEAALMNETLASGYSRMGDEERSREFVRRNQRFISHLPYSEELRSAFTQVVSLASSEGEEERTKWLQALKQRAQRHHDLKALGQAYQCQANDLDGRGDIRGAISRLEEAVALFAKMGDAKHESSALFGLGSGYLAVGDLESAEACADRGLRAAEGRVRQALAISYRTTVPLLLSRGFWERAAEICRKTIQLHHELGLTGMWPTLMLGRTYLAWGKRLEARETLQQAMELVQPDSPLLPLVLVENLCSLEEAYEDSAGFQAFCQRFLEEHPQARCPLLGQWFLEPAEPLSDFPCQEYTEFALPLPPVWKWYDPFADCACTVSAGLEIRAANERELWHRNLSAPRLLQAVSADFAVQTVCARAFVDRPAIGGLCLWKSCGDFLRLDWGVRGEHEVSFDGWLSNSGTRIGRGRLPTERAVLRLERLGSRVRALCSPDGKAWLTVGQVEFPTMDPVEVGLHAIGSIDRTIYPGAYPEGTAIRFEAFELWQET